MTGRVPNPGQTARSIPVQLRATDMARLQASSVRAPHNCIPTHRALSTPEILHRIQAMFDDEDDPDPAGTDENPPPI
ncbi:hypothetical protein MLGJGCBP_07450 [Rhodococcus sp. T7]|nr:hypothetical protein MLGJGCBP_07450 [Rhodococcus sp. T7]